MTDSITGTWQLIKTECIAENGEKLAPPYGGASSMGLLSLREDGRMVCVLCESGDEPISGQTREYMSYCGFYLFNGKELSTHVDACVNPAWIGTDQIRNVSFRDEVMVLQPIKGTGPASEGQRVLHWIKLSEAVG